MAFDFAKAEKQSLKDTSNTKLGLMILGQSGGGKSYAAGTFGVRTLFLYGSGESHGPSAAKKEGGANVVPVAWDFDDEGARLNPDKAYARLMEALSDVEGIKAAGFGAIMVDGATELEQMLRKTKKWEQLCLTDKGKHNNFAEGPATAALFRPVLDGLRDLQRNLGVHYAMTCILDIKRLGEDGAVLESMPRLSGYAVAENLIQQFPDVVVIGRMTKADKVDHYIQFLAGVTKTSKELSGEVKKSINFNPRITGKSVSELPSSVKADLGKLAAFKAGTK